MSTSIDLKYSSPVSWQDQMQQSQIQGTSFEHFYKKLTYNNVQKFFSEETTIAKRVPSSILLFGKEKIECDDAVLFSHAKSHSEKKIRRLFSRYERSFAVATWQKVNNAYQQCMSSKIIEQEEENIYRPNIPNIMKYILQIKEVASDTVIGKFNKEYDTFIKCIQCVRYEKKSEWEKIVYESLAELSKEFSQYKNIDSCLKQECRIATEEDEATIFEAVVEKSVDESLSNRHLSYIRALPEYTYTKEMKEHFFATIRPCSILRVPIQETVCFITSKGLVRQINEDRPTYTSFQIEDGVQKYEATCFGVFDGHGGTRDFFCKDSKKTECVDFVLREYHGVLQSALEQFRSQPLDRRIYNALIQTCIKLQIDWTCIYSENSDAYKQDTGTTACLVLRVDNTFYCANLGDSRAVAIFEDKYYELSQDMTLSNKKFQKSIQERGGTIYRDQNNCFRLEGRLAMAGALGDVSLPALIHRPEIRKISFTLEEIQKVKIIVASDGCFDVIKSPHLCDFLVPKSPLHRLVKSIVQASYHLGSSDNISVVAVEFSLDKRQ